VTLKAHCPHCDGGFEFESARTPAQRVSGRRSRRAGRVIAYYPSCPHCGMKVEVSHPGIIERTRSGSGQRI
jgi:rRNA maturation protein Nop10